MRIPRCNARGDPCALTYALKHKSLSVSKNEAFSKIISSSVSSSSSVAIISSSSTDCARITSSFSSVAARSKTENGNSSSAVKA